MEKLLYFICNLWLKIASYEGQNSQSWHVGNLIGSLSINLIGLAPQFFQILHSLHNNPQRSRCTASLTNHKALQARHSLRNPNHPLIPYLIAPNINRLNMLHIGTY